MPKETTFNIVRVAMARLDVTIEGDDDPEGLFKAIKAAHDLDFTGQTFAYDYFRDGCQPYDDVHHISVATYDHKEHGSNELDRTPAILNDEQLQTLIDAVVIATETQDLDDLTNVAYELGLCDLD